MRLAALVYSLRQAAIFAGLPEEDLLRIASYSVLRLLLPGEYLFRQNDRVTGFYIVRRGLINVHRSGGDGGEQILHLLRAGESFAERALVSESGYPAHARAVQESEVILIPSAPFRLHQRERPDLAWRMLASMSDQLRIFVGVIEGLKYRDAETRLLYWLLQHCPDPHSITPQEIDLGCTKGEMAGQLATRQETLSRLFRKLRAEGLIEVRPKSIVVNDRARMQAVFDAKTEFAD